MALIRNVILMVLLVPLLVSCATVTTVTEIPRRGVTGITDHVTESGVAYTLAAMPDADKVSIHVSWPNDWAHTNNLAVASSIGVDLMSSDGAGERSPQDITRDIIALESAASLVASPDHIYATFTATADNLDDTLDIARDVITVPRLSVLRFDELKSALEQRIESRQQKPSARLWSVARRSLLGDVPLADYWNNLPIENVVSPLQVEDIKRWHKETFTRQGVKVSVAGPIGAKETGRAIDHLLALLPGEPSSLYQPVVVQPRTGYTVLLHDKAILKTQIAVIGLLPASSEGGEVADIVAVSVLGKGKQSRLVKAQQENLPEVGTINTSIANFSRDIRVFGISTEVDNGAVAEVLELIEEEYGNFKRAELDDQEVLRSSVTFANSLKENAQRVDIVAYGLGQLQLDGLPQELLLSVMQDTLALQAADISQRIEARYPDWESMVKVVMSSDAEIVDADCVITQIKELGQCEF